MSPTTERLATALADRYRIERELGQGGMATVHLAEDLKHKRKVALKVLKPELAAVLGAERFVQEITTTAALQHPHILPLFDSGETEGFLWYVMPFIDGETLRSKLDRESQLGVDEAVQIARDVAEALHYAHQHGIIHRDIKPENILLANGRPMVADFGIALAVSAAAGGRMTETGLSLGTPHYMSPEQATAEKEITARSDVYSLGSVLYEMLTGEPPHIGNSAQAIIMKIVTEDAQPVTRLRKSVPPNVAAAVARAVERLPADRFASAAEFAAALANPGFAMPATGGQAGGTAPGLHERGVSRRLFAVVAGVAVLAIGAAILPLLRPDPAPPVRRYQVDLPLRPLRDGQEGRRLLIMPDGRRLVYMAPDGRLWVRALDDLSARPLEGTENAYTPFASPDGNQVGYISPGGRASIRIVSLDGGPPLTIADSGIGLWGATWSRDGHIYTAAAATGVTGIVRVPATGGAPAEPVTVIDRTAGETAHTYPVALPNGKAILFTVQRGSSTISNEIAVTVPGSGTHTRLVIGTAARYAETGHLLYVTSDGTLMGVAFDQDRMRLVGDPVPLLQGLTWLGAYTDAALTLSATGTLWYSTGGVNAMVEPAWVSRTGVATPVDTAWRGDINYPALSPDGAQVAYSMQSGPDIQLWVKRLDRGTPVIFERGGRVNFRPSWSPDGSTIAWISDRGQNSDAYAKPVDQATEAKPLFTTPLPGPVWEVAHALTDGWVLFRVERQGSDIHAIRPGVDSAPITVSATAVSERTPILSPDGRWVAYASDQTGRYEVYVRPFPNVADAVWQVSTEGGSLPRFSRSGQELFFVSAANDLRAVAVLPGATFAWGEPRTLFSLAGYRLPTNGRGFDISPGDERFLMLRLLEDTTRTEVVVVENFFEELRAKVKR